ncbi:MAG: hypothetical protein H6Q17_2370 [Bacteroidetes bacterium]|nr:hypothetical protein [Bacteroidota bacterium]
MLGAGVSHLPTDTSNQTNVELKFQQVIYLRLERFVQSD